MRWRDFCTEKLTTSTKAWAERPTKWGGPRWMKWITWLRKIWWHLGSDRWPLSPTRRASSFLERRFLRCSGKKRRVMALSSYPNNNSNLPNFSSSSPNNEIIQHEDQGFYNYPNMIRDYSSNESQMDVVSTNSNSILHAVSNDGLEMNAPTSLQPNSIQILRKNPYPYQNPSPNRNLKLSQGDNVMAFHPHPYNSKYPKPFQPISYSNTYTHPYPSQNLKLNLDFMDSYQGLSPDVSPKQIPSTPIHISPNSPISHKSNRNILNVDEHLDEKVFVHFFT